MKQVQIRQIEPYLWEIPRSGDMIVPARIYATRKMMRDILKDRAAEQARNVAHLPGIVKASLAMPDIHWGYGFPIGGVAAFDANGGVISPGGVGYDINCGVRLMASNLQRSDVADALHPIVNQLFKWVPTGVGSAGALRVSVPELQEAAVDGARWAVRKGYGSADDLAFIEESGQIDGADVSAISHRAWKRGAPQLGTLGSGNHFLEFGYVDEVFDDGAAAALGLQLDQVTLIIHTGSRGFGHQTCEDNLSVMDGAMRKYGMKLPDRQLACAPIRSAEGQRYLGAMNCAVNFAFANRQIIAHNARRAFCEALGIGEAELGLRTVYEVAHNIAKFESHVIDGEARDVCVHRKGATRAFGPGSASVPARYRGVGQPVLVPGDMGRYSYVLVGTERAMQDTFGSTCHGAGRQMSRRKAAKTAQHRDIKAELEERGIVVRGASRRTINEELPEAYKDVAEVVETCQMAGISKKVARLIPLGCIKG
ncbi:MAG: RtcB family protein [Rhodothermales bacterium]|nr:RtcB family protein [Rhodothermales bacterium]